MRNDNRPAGYHESVGRGEGTLEEMSHILRIETVSPWIKQELGVSAGSPEGHGLERECPRHLRVTRFGTS